LYSTNCFAHTSIGILATAKPTSYKPTLPQRGEKEKKIIHKYERNKKLKYSEKEEIILKYEIYDYTAFYLLR